MYRTICTQLWTDKKVQRLSVQGKLLFVYLITNPHTHLSGIYYIPKELIKLETGLSDTLLDTLWHTLSGDEHKLAYYDPDNSIVFVRNMFRYQGKGEKNERSAANHLKTLHDSSLIPLFLENYQSVKPYCDASWLDTLSDTLSDPSKRCPSVPSPVPVLLVKEKRVREKRLDIPIPSDWTPKEKHSKLCSVRGLDLAIEANHFKGKAQELGWVTMDWDLKFTNWLLQEIKFRQRRQG
jgi:hypothetical protein